MPADEWLITPVWAGSTTGAVRLSYKVATYTEGSADYDVCIAYTDNVDDLKNNVVFSETNLITNHYIQESEAFFGVEPNRQYYVAFHLKTPIYDHSVTSFMYFDLMDIKCEEADGLIPMPVTIGEITPDPDFAGLEFDVTLPAKTIINTDISAQTVYAEYTVNGEKYGVISGAPGETVHQSLKPLTLGKTSLKFTTYVLEGETRHGDRAE
ncbi:MAG: hypothetical protein K2O10_06975, partial [Muribaculaceae bacterium]|nr:hypothetical protein [Muribaculaceae bacterium]